MLYKTGEFGPKPPGKEAERSTVSFIILIVQLRQRILTPCVAAAVAETWNQAGVYNVDPRREDTGRHVAEDSLWNPPAWRALYEVPESSR